MSTDGIAKTVAEDSTKYGVISVAKRSRGKKSKEYYKKLAEDVKSQVVDFRVAMEKELFKMESESRHMEPPTRWEELKYWYYRHIGRRVNHLFNVWHHLFHPDHWYEGDDY